MTIVEWKAKYPLIGWSIFKREFRPSVKFEDNKEQWSQEYDDRELDFSTDAPDGMYDVKYGYGDHEDWVHGLIVEDGQFLITPTNVDLLYRLLHRNLTNEHIKETDRVIERLELENGAFRLQCGS